MHTRRPPRLPGALLLLAIAVGCRSDGELSSEQKEKLVERHTEIAQQYMHMGELDRAEGQTLKGLELDPDNAKLKMVRAWTLQKRGRPVDLLAAEALFRELEPQGDYRATLGLAAALERKGVALLEASEDIRSGRRISEAPDPEKRADELADESRHAWTESATKYSKTLVQHPGDLDALNGLSRVEALRGRREPSLAAAEQLIASLDDDLVFWEQKLRRPDISEGEEDRFRKLIRQQTELSIATRRHASAMLYELGRYQEAVTHLDAAIALDPERPELLGRRAELHERLGEYASAVQDLDSFIRLSRQPFDHPDIKRAWRLHAECQEKLRAQELGTPRSAGAR